MRAFFEVTAIGLAVGCAGAPSAETAGDAGAPDATAPDATADGGGDAADAADAATDASPRDASAGDAGADADASVPQMGMTWPQGQIFPSFAPPGALDVVMSSGRANDVLTLVTTLQGLVNKTVPRIYISDDGTTARLWLTEMHATTTVVSDPLSLLTKYRSEIAGIVIDDDAVPDTLNLATTIAGLKGGIVASPALATTLTAAPYNLPVLDDLRTNHFASKLDVYQYELDHYSAQATHRLIIGLTPSIVDHLRDYAVATQAMMVWLDPTVAAEKSLLGQFLALLPPNSPYMGWWTNEPEGVKTAATYAVPVYAADWSMNLTVLGGTPRGSTPPTAPPPPVLENKLYIAIFMSDGDNLQEDEGLVPLKWADSNRGNVPISWTLSPALVDVSPVILRYFQRTATVNDLLVSGPSGLGYTYPAQWPGTTFDDYTKVSGRYMDAAGLRVATVWNNGADLSPTNAQAYASNVPNLLGLTIQDSTTAEQFVGTGLPIERMTLSYGDNASILETGVDNALHTYDGTKPVFAAIQGDMNQGTINPSAFLDVQSHYAANTNVVFVRGDHFFQLVSRAHAPPAHKLYGGDFDGNGKSDVLMYYAGNGDFWLGLSDGANLNFTNAGNQSGFGNLLDGGHAIFTGDFTGDGKTDVAFYYPGDSRWWLGTSTGTALTWTSLGTTPNFGNLLDGKHRVQVGDYDGNGKADFCVYASGDGSFQLGLSNGSSLTWKSAGMTSGFGNLLDGSHAFFDGDFDGDGKEDVLFFYNGDKSLWLGRSDGNTLTWTKVGDESGFGNLIDRDHRMLAGDFNGDTKTDLAFYFAGDEHWWLGISNGSGFTWSLAATTTGAGHFLDWNHRVTTTDVDNDGKLDVVSYDSASGDWTVGRSNGSALTFAAMGNTASLGDVADYGHLLFVGDYDGDGKREPLLHEGTSGKWTMGHSDGTMFTFHPAANTSGFGDLTR
jgi:hypothetical protein